MSACVKRTLAAFLYAFFKHWGQVRKSDECMPFVFHSVLAAWLARTYTGLEGNDRVRATIVALLHDVLEDTNTRYGSVRRWFGLEVADGVAAMSNSKALVAQGVSKQLLLDEKLVRLKQQPLWVKVVEPASRYANLLEPGDWDDEKRFFYARDSVYALEVLDIPACKLRERLYEQLQSAEAAYRVWCIRNGKE
jgi:guanosine-3',5'-bis(diphosphate) 3'-pyrophosphohydrolase